MKFRFPLIFGLGVVAFELIIVAIMFFSAPAGTRWLGDTMQNSSDAAVYLSYLHQGADGKILLDTLYAVEPHALRFDPVWSLLGIIARTVPPIAAHEGARVVCTLILAFAVFFAARSVTSSHRDARLATVLAFGGVGAGWLYSVWLGANAAWTPANYAAPDIVTEFSIAPVLLAGAHMILSIALLLVGMRTLWAFITDIEKRLTSFPWLLVIAWSILLSFHPYFVPLYGIAAVIMIGMRKKFLLNYFILAIPLLPATIIYAPLAFDPVFRTHHLIVNYLPLAPPLSWLAMFLPFAVAIAWRVQRKIRITQNEQWLLVWIASAIVCILLPLPWKRKYTEGLGIALVFLTLPAWLAVRDWVMKERSRLIRTLMGGMLLLAACFTPLHLFMSHLTWISVPSRQHWFYQPNDVFDTWSFIHDTLPTSSVILSDDRWINVWIPAYAGRTVWVAHDHETPDFERKLAEWKQLMATEDPAEAQRILKVAGITHFMTTNKGSSARFQRLIGATWDVVFERGDVRLFILRKEG